MRKLAISSACLLCFIQLSFGQGQDEDIVAIIDDLTVQWDEGAVKMKTFEGLKDYCRIAPYRNRTRDLLNTIHHYDTVLYQTVIDKFDTSQDAEAAATIKDIEKLEIEYTTRSFFRFLHTVCNTLNEIENNLKEGSREYNKEVEALEAELVKYITGITSQVDIIDEHVHHLKGL